MLLIRPKRRSQYQRGYSFTLSDFIGDVLRYPFVVVLAAAAIFVEEFIAVLVIAVPGIILALVIAGGDMGVAWELIKEYWKLVVSVLMLGVYVIKMSRSSNKQYK